MGGQIKYSVQDIRLGALYRLGVARGFGRETLVHLMVERAGMVAARAEQLASHWLTTEPFRRQHS